MEVMKRYSFWIGIALVFIGLVVYWVLGVWDVASLIPLGVGALLAIIGIIINWREIQASLGRRTTKYGMSSVTGIVIVVVILIIVNVFLKEFHWRTDTTAGGQYSLADQTVKVLKNLDNEVDVKIFDVESKSDRITDRMDEYDNYSNKFKWQFIDPDKHPEVAKRYNIKKLGTVVVESGTKTERIDNYNEQDLTNAIIKVTRTETKTVYFTSGHGEHTLDSSDEQGFKMVADAIKDQNYVAKKLVLATQDSVPADASVIVVAGAKNAFFPKELKLLGGFIREGGDVLFLLDPPPSQGFKDFLGRYHIQVDDDIVIDASGIGQLFGTGPAVPLINNYEDHAITNDFGLMTFYPLARSIELTVPSDSTSQYNGKAIARTNNRSWGETDLNAKQASRDANDISGPLSLAVAMEISGGRGANSRLVVFGDSDFATNRYFGAQGNGDLFMNSVNWLLQDEDLISVRPKQPEDRRIQMTQSQVKTVLILFVILLPVAILLAGGVVYWRRR